MAGASASHAAYAGLQQNQQDRLFSLPNEEPATFFFHNFENADLTNRIFEHGGRITDSDDDADVILTTSREEYISLKDKYAISRKTHVRMSGFVDRCIDARRFQLAPIPEKGVSGRKLISRRTEFTKDDDEHLCQYIAEVLPDQGEGGRTGHFIYADLKRRANEFGQYEWAHRHPEGGWRERYRKNRDRMDNRIAQIVEENPPPPDGKGRYKYRRHGKTDEDDELNADGDGLVGLDEEERRDSATDEEEDPVQIRRANALRQEEEEEEEDGEGQAVMHRSEASSNLRNRDALRQEEESAEEQAGEKRQPEGRRTRSTTRPTRGVAKGRRTGTRTRRTALGEPDDLDATLQGDAELDYDNPAEEPVPGPPSSYEVEKIGNRKKKQSKVEARRAVQPSLSPRRTRAGLRSQSIQPEAVPTASRTTSRAKAKATASTADTAVLKPVPELQSSDEFDEFVARSNDDDESEMHEVEANLQILGHSRESLASIQMHRVEDLQASRREQRTRPTRTKPARDDRDEDEEDSDDAKLLSTANKLDIHAPPVPSANLNRSGRRDRDQRSSEEIFPSPGTRARDEKKRRTEDILSAPYVPPRGTRAASMIEREQARVRRVAVTTRSKR